MFTDSLFKIYGVTQKARVILWLIVLAIATFIGWSYFATLDEVAIGEGKVIPSQKGQIIQNLEGGILAELAIREGDQVKKGQVLAILRPELARASLDETTARIISLKARAARLDAELNDADKVTFPKELDDHQDAVERESKLFIANRRAIKENIENLETQLDIADEQLKIAKPLLDSGASSKVEVLRLQQNEAELRARLSATRSEYYVSLRDDFAKTMGELEPLIKSRDGLTDQMNRTIIKAPTDGVVKDIRVTTVGGIVSPGGTLMEIVPSDDTLLIEAKINPRDIAFIHPNQYANVKITAYDSGVYGSLEGKVVNISPDTIEDDVDKRIYYYRVYIKTDRDAIDVKDDQGNVVHEYKILPGMIATAEIRTGQKTVMAYLLKPLNRAHEALRER